MAEDTPKDTAETILSAARANPGGVVGVRCVDLLHAFGTQQEQEQAGNDTDTGHEGGNAQG